MRVINKICLFGLNWFVSFRFVSTKFVAVGDKQGLFVWFEMVCFVSRCFWLALSMLHGVNESVPVL